MLNTIVIKFFIFFFQDFKMNSKLVHQPMVTDEPNNEIVNSDIPPLSDHMNISLAFKKIMSEDPPRYTELCEAVNKTFEEISDSIR